MANTSFTASGYGTNSGSLSGGGLEFNQGSIIIQGNTMISQPQGAMIPNLQDIYIQPGPTGYSFEIVVIGGCPKGLYDLKLEFTDQNADTYVLRIYNETTHTHTLDYNSTGGTIVSVKWS